MGMDGLGVRIKKARADAGLTQRELAERLEVDPMRVSRWERDEHTPSVPMLLKVAHATDKTFGWFFDERTVA